MRTLLKKDESLENIYRKAIDKIFLTQEEALYLYENAPLVELMSLANSIKKELHPNNIVTWLIDRNVNITNACISQCKFCNFYRKINSEEIFTTTLEEYKEKIETLKKYGGKQLLLQGGLHPKYDINFYTNLFSELKKYYPELKLHALGPPEIAHIAKISNLTIKETLENLVKSGLDSLPGAGAEILCDRVRKQISPAKCDTETWLEVMRQAHKLNLITSATMMLGHVETKAERIEHLIKIRNLQHEKPNGNHGFLAFIPWTFHGKNTKLQAEVNQKVSPEEYIRTIAIARIVLLNIPHIQASWLTVGKEIAQVCLHAGADDFGSIMIEENVVSAAGASFKFDAEGIQKAIKEAGFDPKLRNQEYKYIEYKNR